MRRIVISLALVLVPISTAFSTQADVESTGPCSIVGDWNGVYPPGPYPFSGTPLTFSFRADGTGESKSSRANSPVAWHMDGANLSFHGTTPPTTRFSCKVEDEGKYSLTFSADCSTVKFGLVSDPCAGRAATANNMSLTRNK